MYFADRYRNIESTQKLKSAREQQITKSQLNWKLILTWGSSAAGMIWYWKSVPLPLLIEKAPRLHPFYDFIDQQVH